MPRLRNTIARSHRAGAAALGLSLVCAGCSGGLEIAMPSLPKETPEFPGSSTAVYTRVARGANSCWFGPRGILDKTYIYHARAEPEAKGGIAEILVHERFDKNQRGLKAFTVTIAPRGDGAAVAAVDLKMPAPLGQRMTADTYRWAKGLIGCADGDTNWETALPAAASTSVETKKTKVPKRTAGTGPAPAKAPDGKAAAGR